MTDNMPPLVVRAEEWPHGLTCMDCNRPLVEGDPYTERLEGMVDEIPLTEVTCLECGFPS